MFSRTMKVIRTSQQAFISLMLGLGIFCSTAPLHASGSNPLPAFKADYVLEVLGYGNGKATVTLDASESHQHQRLSATASFPIEIKSNQQIIVLHQSFTHDALFDNSTPVPTPIKYQSMHKGLIPLPGQTLTFNKDKGIITSSSKQSAPIAWDGQATDPLTFYARFIKALATNKPQSEYLLITKDKPKKYTLKKISADTLETPLGRVNVDIYEIARPNKNAKTTIWLTDSQPYIPVKIIHNKKGKQLGQATLVSYQPQ